ncbi:hypothetical protein MRS44_013258 [Fusarium solani]|uniref:uncharacterized protein n=1 Tax=Fusarium solani TaxID=169388 RepID=UPI0032C415AC|nr:hypothetical protein MRS44_013258 [Fusarium solani]
MIRELNLGLLINTDVPFSFFTDPFFEQLAWQLDPHLSGQVPWSRQSMSLLDDMYKPKKDRVKQELLDALTKIHLGFDMWTSPNRHTIMAATAHFLDRQGKHQSRLLALRRQLGCHSGENLAVRDAKIRLSDYLDRWYRCKRPVDEQRKAIAETMASPSVLRKTPKDSVFKQWVKNKTAKTTVMGSELERYLRLEPQEIEDPIEWWMARQGQFPMVVQPGQVAVDVAEAFNDDRNIGEVAVPQELGRAWCGDAGPDSTWER